jgi:signal transduction histidine kinase
VSIRLRVAVVFALALAIAFALGSWLLVSQVSTVVLNSVDTALTAQLGQAGRLAPNSGSAGSPAQLAPGDYLIQLIDPSGRVAAAGPDAGDVSLLTPALHRTAQHGRVVVTRTIDGEAERVMAGPLPARPGWVAAAAVSLESADATTSALVTRLAIGGSIFVVLAGAGAYLLARAALAPADRLRREAAALSARDPAARLAVPKTRDEIAALARTMNELLGRLQMALARQRSFVSDASHELRTPFAVLQGELELAARPGRSRDELAEAVASARDEAARLSRITDDLLLLARSDESQLVARAGKADLGALLGRSADLARHRAASQGVIVQVRCPPGLTAHVDAGLIRQAVDNLLDNALRFAPAGSQVDLIAAASGAGVTIAVADTGAGFPADFLPHAFERFRRPDDGRSRAAGGAGLGLAIVAAIAGAHGGTASARNRPGGGAEVTLQLPDASLP